MRNILRRPGGLIFFVSPDAFLGYVKVKNLWVKTACQYRKQGDPLSWLTSLSLHTRKSDIFCPVLWCAVFFFNQIKNWRWNKKNNKPSQGFFFSLFSQTISVDSKLKVVRQPLCGRAVQKWAISDSRTLHRFAADSRSTLKTSLVSVQ